MLESTCKCLCQQAIYLLLLTASLCSYQPIWGASDWALSKTLEVNQGDLQIIETPRDVFVVHGDWRFSGQTVESMNDALFDLLPLKNPLTGSLHYVSLAELPEKGAFILRIHSRTQMKLAFMFGGLVAAGDFSVIDQQGKRIVYEFPEALTNKDSLGRLQIFEPVFTVDLAEGTSYFVYSYRQKLTRKANVMLSNAGLVGPFFLSNQHKMSQHVRLREVLLKVPLGVLSCLTIYSLLIYFSRHREDKESMILSCFNGIATLREFFSQGILLSFVPSNALLINLHAITLSLAFLATAISVHYLHYKIATRALTVFKGIFTANFLITAINSCLLINVPSLPNTSLLFTYIVIFHSIVFFLGLIPYTLWLSLKIRKTEITNFTVGVLFLAVGTLIDYINIVGNFGWPWMSMIGGMVLSILLAKNNSSLFAEAYETSQKLNTALIEKNKEVVALNYDLKVETETKSAVAAKAAHHLNNPIQAIDSLMAGSIAEIQCIEKRLESMFPAEWERTPEAQEIVDRYRRSFATIYENSSMMKRSLRRVTTLASELGIISGIQGVSLQRIIVSDLWQAIKMEITQDDVLGLKSIQVKEMSEEEAWNEIWLDLVPFVRSIFYVLKEGLEATPKTVNIELSANFENSNADRAVLLIKATAVAGLKAQCSSEWREFKFCQHLLRRYGITIAMQSSGQVLIIKIGMAFKPTSQSLHAA